MAARRCANPDCGRDLTGFRPQAVTCSHRCRQKVYRHAQSSRFEHEPLVVEQLRARRLKPEEALLWVLFPERMRRSASYRVEREAVTA
jgi:hypothetical protein